MTTEEIRLKILKEQVNYQNAVEGMKKSSDEITQLIGSFSEDDMQQLISVGINTSSLFAIDMDRCVGDSEYLQQKMLEFEEAITKLHAFLEEELNV